MKKEIIFENKALYRDNFRITGFRIGEGKLRRLVQENPRADYLLWNGNRVQIKREKFEKFIDTLSAV